MNKVLLWVIVAVILAVAVTVYRSQKSTDELKVVPDVRREIEKAKRQ